MKNVVFTKHALEQISKRRISRSDAIYSINEPDKIKRGKSSQTREYVKRFGKKQITTIVSENEKNKIVVSVWIDPPMPNTSDATKYRRYLDYKDKLRKSSWIGKLILTIKKQLIG